MNDVILIFMGNESAVAGKGRKQEIWAKMGGQKPQLLKR